MNLQQFKQKLRDLKINQRILARDLGISFQQVTNWNKNGVYPYYVTIYFENINNKDELEALKAKVKNLLGEI